MKSTTQIQLFGQVEGVLTTVETTAFPMTFAVADIRDISKRTGSFSKSITIPDTKENNQLLNFYYDVNIQAGTFNINVIQECAVIQNGITILDNMVMQLISVNKEQTDNNYEDKITYTVLIKDRTGDFFSQIGSKKLSDLTGFSGMVGNLTVANIQNSWIRNSYIQGWKFLQPALVKEKTFNTLPYMDISEFMPGIYAKTYFDRIFSDAGYSYEWSTQFEDNVEFHKLIIPYNGDKPKTSEVEANAFLVSIQNNNLTTTTNTSIQKTQNGYAFLAMISLNDSAITRMGFPTEIQDQQNLFSTATGFYTSPNIPANKKITFEFEIDYQINVTNGNAFNVSAFTHNVVLPGAPVLKIEPRFIVRQNGKDLTTQPISTTTIANNTRFVPGSTNIASGTSTIAFTTEGILPASAIDFYIQLGCAPSQATGLWISNFYQNTNSVNVGPAPNCTVNYRVTSRRLVIRTLEETEYGYNIPVFLHNFIPKNVQQSSFLSSIFTMYNLYTEIDKTNPKKLILKHRDDYYDEGAVTDWTFKLDKSQKQDLKFLPELQNKKLLLTYKLDTDEPNKTYFDATGEVFGQTEFTFQNEYTRGVNKKELIFSPTPSFDAFGMVLPLYNGAEPKNNIRILYDGGVRSSQQYIIVNYRNGTTLGDWNASTGTGYNYYGHWNTPNQPSFDINFGMCDYYFRTSNYGSPTNNNLYNLFWRRTLAQIDTGKMLTAYIDLNEYDIQKLKLNDKIRVDNSWWNINKIIDYNSNSNSSTKVELLSIDDELKLTPFLTRPVTIENDASIRIRRPFRWWHIEQQRTNPWNNNLTDWLVPIQGHNNWVIQPTRTGYIWGDDNYLANDGLILGDGNVSSGKKAFIVGDGNVVTADNLTNVVVLGSGIVPTSANTVYTNNIIMSTGATINGVDTTGVLLSHGNTGVLTFSGITGVSSTQISISPVTGFVVDNETNANVPAYIYITYSGTSAITVNTISSSTVSYVLLDNAGVPFFQTTFPTSAQRKANIWLGKMSHPNLTTLGVVVNEPDFITSPLQQHRDLFQATPYINNGVYPSANGANLNVNTTTGSILGDGINFHLNNRDPNTIVEPPHTPLSFVYRTQTGGTTGFVIAINPASYDVGGVVTPVGGGANTSTIQYIFIIPAVGYTILYGQTTYSSLANAIAAVGTENPTIFPNLINNSLLIGIVAVNKNATQLNDPAQARFFRADIFGQIIGAVGGTSTGSLQTAYNNSGVPQILTTSLGGAVTFRGWDGSTNRLLNLQNSAGTTTAFFTEGGSMSVTSMSATTLNLNSLSLASAGTVHLGINTSNQVVTLPPDESTEFICRNASGVSIPAGAPVYISGGFGNRPTVAMASSNSGVTNAFCIGLMKATTANNADGICIMAGVADGLNTNAWVAGTPLYLSSTAGVLTSTVPLWPEIVVQVATVARQHLTQGALLVRPLLTFSLDKVVDVNVTGQTNGQVLAWNSVQSAWTNSSSAILTALTSTTISATTYNNIPFWTSGTGLNSIVQKFGANSATGNYSIAMGTGTTAQGIAAHTEGINTSTLGTAAHAEGSGTIAADNYAHAEGNATQANGVGSHAEGGSTNAIGDYSHAEGFNTSAGFETSHAEGSGTTTGAEAAHAEGVETNANGVGSHAEGANSTASGEASHAEGAGCVADGNYGHAEGFATSASLKCHAEGNQTNAVGDNSHSEGSNTFASGETSHAGGIGAITKNIGEWARSSYGENNGGFGQYGILDYVGTTANATPTEIFIGNTERLFIEAGSTYRYELRLIARAANGEAKERYGPGLISNSGGTTFFIGNPNLGMTTQFQSAGFTTVAITQIADDTIDALRLEVTGLSATTLQWYVKLDYIKIS